MRSIRGLPRRAVLWDVTQRLRACVEACMRAGGLESMEE